MYLQTQEEKDRLLTVGFNSKLCDVLYLHCMHFRQTTVNFIKKQYGQIWSANSECIHGKSWLDHNHHHHHPLTYARCTDIGESVVSWKALVHLHRELHSPLMSNQINFLGLVSTTVRWTSYIFPMATCALRKKTNKGKTIKSGDFHLVYRPCPSLYLAILAAILLLGELLIQKKNCLYLNSTAKKIPTSFQCSLRSSTT